MAVIMLYP